MTQVIRTLIPDSGRPSLWSGLGQSNTGQLLQSAPSTGQNSVAYWVASGVTNPNDNTSWSNETSNADGWFDVKLSELDVFPSSISVRIRSGFTSAMPANVREMQLLFKKSDNPTLGNDVFIVNQDLNTTYGGFGSFTDQTLNLTILEANRTSFNSGIPNGIPTLSGRFEFDAFGNSGEFFISEIDIRVSGLLGDTIPVSSGNIDLYIGGHITISGDIGLFIGGYSSGSTPLDLYIAASINESGNLDLYTGGLITNSGNLDLYIAGPIETSGNLDLYLGGFSNQSGITDLYTIGGLFGSGALDLFMVAIDSHTASMNLFCEAKGTLSSGNLPLYIYSLGNSGLYRTVDLTVWNDNQFDNRNVMNLYTIGPSFSDTSSTMNLYLESSNSGSWSLDLFLQNSYASISGYQPLFIAAPSGTLGATPLSGIMNLVMWRDQESTSEWLPLYLAVTEQLSGTLTLYIAGETTSNNTLHLFMSGIQTPTNTLMFYTHGI